MVHSKTLQRPSLFKYVISCYQPILGKTLHSKLCNGYKSREALKECKPPPSNSFLPAFFLLKITISGILLNLDQIQLY